MTSNENKASSSTSDSLSQLAQSADGPERPSFSPGSLSSLCAAASQSSSACLATLLGAIQAVSGSSSSGSCSSGSSTPVCPLGGLSGDDVAKVAPFVVKTFQLVSEKSHENIVSWSPAHNSFVIHDPGEFSSKILPKYFKHNNLSSFFRQLNTYGFRKISSKDWEFGHPFFMEGAAHLLANIVRRQSKRRQSSRSDSDEEPPPCKARVPFVDKPAIQGCSMYGASLMGRGGYPLITGSDRKSGFASSCGSFECNHMHGSCHACQPSYPSLPGPSMMDEDSSGRSHRLSSLAAAPCTRHGSPAPLASLMSPCSLDERRTAAALPPAPSSSSTSTATPPPLSSSTLASAIMSSSSSSSSCSMGGGMIGAASAASSSFPPAGSSAASQASMVDSETPSPCGGGWGSFPRLSGKGEPMMGGNSASLHPLAEIFYELGHLREANSWLHQQQLTMQGDMQMLKEIIKRLEEEQRDCRIFVNKLYQELESMHETYAAHSLASARKDESRK